MFVRGPGAPDILDGVSRLCIGFRHRALDVDMKTFSEGQGYLCRTPRQLREEQNLWLGQVKLEISGGPITRHDAEALERKRLGTS